MQESNDDGEEEKRRRAPGGGGRKGDYIQEMDTSGLTGVITLGASPWICGARSSIDV